VDPLGTQLRALAPQVLGALVRHHGGFDACEDAVQEALLAAATQWPVDGIPDHPKNWLITVASRRRIELHRADTARRRREETAFALTTPDPEPPPGVDDTLTLLRLCCHPSLTPPSQVALTLRAVGGLTTAEIARAFLVPEATMAQRISRAKHRIKTAGAHFDHPADDERLDAVRHVLYLVFTEGHTAGSGTHLHRVDLSAEAIRLTRELHTRRPHDGETTGLLALMLLTDARRPARTRTDGSLVPLADQDRTRWDTDMITEGTRLLHDALTTTAIGPYQLQAAIAALHAEAHDAAATDWRQILALYDLLHTLTPGPMVTLNRIVAAAMTHGPAAGLARLDEAATDPALAGHHRVDAVRAHLLDLAGDHDTAREHYTRAARATHSLPERRYLEERAAADRHP
jgi:RNA polymerase sigma factor (sigma-70 family)